MPQTLSSNEKKRFFDILSKRYDVEKLKNIFIEQEINIELDDFLNSNDNNKNTARKIIKEAIEEEWWDQLLSALRKSNIHSCITDLYELERELFPRKFLSDEETARLSRIIYEVFDSPGIKCGFPEFVDTWLNHKKDKFYKYITPKNIDEVEIIIEISNYHAVFTWRDLVEKLQKIDGLSKRNKEELEAFLSRKLEDNTADKPAPPSFDVIILGSPFGETAGKMFGEVSKLIEALETAKISNCKLEDEWATRTIDAAVSVDQIFIQPVGSGAADAYVDGTNKIAINFKESASRITSGARHIVWLPESQRNAKFSNTLQGKRAIIKDSIWLCQGGEESILELTNSLLGRNNCDEKRGMLPTIAFQEGEVAEIGFMRQELIPRINKVLEGNYDPPDLVQTPWFEEEELKNVLKQLENSDYAILAPNGFRFQNDSATDMAIYLKKINKILSKFHRETGIDKNRLMLVAICPTDSDPTTLNTHPSEEFQFFRNNGSELAKWHLLSVKNPTGAEAAVSESAIKSLALKVQGIIKQLKIESPT